jgi:hypothetical protein
VNYNANGNKFEGEFKDGYYNGKGVEYFANGDKFEGEYRDDKRNGIGTYYNNKQKFKETGEWKDDEKVGTHERA